MKSEEIVMRINWVAALAMAAGVSTAVPSRAAPVNAKGSCVACHRDLKAGSGLRHSFSDWAGSAHAAAHVECEACHGGDPTKPDQASAHKGLKPSTEAASPVYYTKLPATCGRCHAAEYKAFQQSAHFKELSTSGKGPNCVTCHGAMASHVLDARTMEMTCTLCHRRPTQAYAARQAIYYAKGQVGSLKIAVERARQAGTEVKAQAAALDDVDKRYAALLVDWHTFKMDGVVAAAREISHRAIQAKSELKVKSESGGGR